MHQAEGVEKEEVGKPGRVGFPNLSHEATEMVPKRFAAVGVVSIEHQQGTLSATHDLQEWHWSS